MTPQPVLFFLAALVLARSAALSAQSDPITASRAAYQKALTAYQAHDLTDFLRHATEAARLRPTHGDVLYALASAQAMAGDGAAALTTLQHFAAPGYTANVAADSDLVSLRALPGFDALNHELERNAAPLAPGRPAFTLGERDLLTEGIAHDAATGSFFVGSVHRRTIMRVDARGGASVFVAPGAHGLWAPFGMRVDRVRRALWVATTAVPQMIGFDPADSARSGLSRYDLVTGTLTGHYPIRSDGMPHALGDLIVSRSGDVYATDSRSPTIYRVRAGADSLEPFVTSPLLRSAQGIALDRNERALYVADYGRGILRVDLASRAVALLPVEGDILTLGIDGLYLAGHDLIAIQNGVEPHRVVRLRLDPAGGRILGVTVLERARPDYAEPTLGVVVDGALYYVANSQWERFHDDGSIDAPERLQAPLVLRLPL